jgi:hypothetical protein
VTGTVGSARTPADREGQARADSGPGLDPGRALRISELPPLRRLLNVVRAHPDLVAELVLLLAAEALVLAAVDPAAALRNVLPYGSDQTGHPYNVSELAANLHHFQLTGWSQGWYDGFPTGVLYPVLAPGIAAVASLIIPLAVAFKLTVAAGPVLLPVCAYLAGRLARLPRACAVLLAVFTLPFLFDVSCNVCGGPIESTMVGEYAYSWGIAFGLLSLGATVRLCEGSGSRWWPPLLLGAAALAHPVTALWTALGVVLIIGHAWWFQRRPPVRTAIPLLLGLLLGLTWWLPFLADRQFMPEPLQVKYTEYLTFLFPASGPWDVALTALAAAGAFWAYRNRQLLLVGVVGLTVLMGLAFRLLPVSQLPNWRVLELWLLGLWLLAAVGCLETVRWLIARLRMLPTRRLFDGQVRYTVAAVVVLVVSLTQGIPWGLWPGEHLVNPASPHERWLGIDFPAVLQADFAPHIFGGVPANPGASQYDAMISALESVARQHGCGRVAFDENISTAGTTHFYNETDSLPLITNGCLSTLTGTLPDSADNTPEILVTESLVSEFPEQYMPSIPYLKFNLGLGVKNLRLLGAKYYVTHGGADAAAAARQPDLSLVGSTPQVQVWEISDAGIVAPLSFQPVVATGFTSKVSWQDYYLVYGLTTEWGRVVETQHGPPNWPRTAVGVPPSLAPLPPVSVTDVTVTSTSISFTVSRTGVPVEVRDTYFPGWQVHGGSGPYRAMPDFMVVVPTSSHVTLTYSTSGVITTADVLGVLGLLGVVALGIADQRRRRVAVASPAVPAPREGGKPPASTAQAGKTPARAKTPVRATKSQTAKTPAAKTPAGKTGDRKKATRSGRARGRRA